MVSILFARAIIYNYVKRASAPVDTPREKSVLFGFVFHDFTGSAALVEATN